ncbi:peptidase M10A and M12B matrixin and adamalysin [Methylomonas sp. 2BW1-5-20]|uniref:peptidase M10A and M12B matrixin and adamalysin n=1 Tax=Methylomonas sp. 2BW1-5-20 TaxID=3376686 RepID=UPI0040517BD2
MSCLSKPINQRMPPSKSAIPGLGRNAARAMRLAAALALPAMAFPARAITVQFDYSYDTRGFFTDSVSGEPIAERRALLELAAGTYARFSDHLTPISPQAGDTWSVTITHPSLGGPPLTLTDLSVAADTIRVYVGGSPSAPGVLGFAGTGSNLNANGSAAFVADVNSRGQTNTSGDSASDYGVWGGYIWFNAAQDWYFGAAAGLSPGRPDFLTTATHELGHILGFGTADSWFSQIDETGHTFTGAASTAVYGGPVPLDSFYSHWAEGVNSDVDGIIQETLMDPSTVRGQRELMTRLDYAGFSDIGWQVTAVPLPASAWLFGSTLLGWFGRSRRKSA